MGHANLSNLSRLFVRHLYAKGVLTIEQAIAFAQKKGEEVQASEGGYNDDGMLSYAFGEIVQHLNSEHGSGYTQGYCPPRHWDGPFIVPVYRWPSQQLGAEETTTMSNLLKQCHQVYLTHEVHDNKALFGVCADAIEDGGYTEWAARVREFALQQWIYHEWKNKNWDVFDDEANYMAFDRIQWKFAPGWRSRYQQIPLLSHVTN